MIKSLSFVCNILSINHINKNIKIVTIMHKIFLPLLVIGEG